MNRFYHIQVFIVTMLAFTTGDVVFSQTKIIEKGSEWQYYDEHIAPPVGWEGLTNVANSWKKGTTPLGYGDSFVETEISFGEDPANKDITRYFRKSFRIDNPFEHIVYRLNLQKDDGAIVYLNGREIMRSDMPLGKITHETKAGILIIGEMEEVIHTKVLSPDDFIAGINVISASVHQGQVTSSDLIFNLELIGDSTHDMVPIILEQQTLKNLNLNLKFQELKNQQELERKNLQLAFAERIHTNVKAGLYIFIVLFVVSLLTLFFMLKTFVKRVKERNRTISKLEEINRDKDREMMSISINSLNNQKYLVELKKDLELSADVSDVSSIKRAIKKITESIKYNLEHNEDLDNLKKHFNAVHTGFFDKLTNLHPSLTEVELRHCSFIKLHMQTKEIASILHIDPKSVQTSRYRIKKKMNLEEKVDLKDYLLNL